MKPKKYRMTQHARDRAKERGISGREIQEVLDSPKVQVVQLAHSSVKAWKLVGDRKITVVYTESALNEATIITVYADEEKAADGR